MAVETIPNDETYVTVEGEEPILVTSGSGNIFEDLGFEAPEEELAKAHLVLALMRIVKELRSTQREAARGMGVTRLLVSRLLHGDMEGVSSDRLPRMIAHLGRDVDIVVKPADTETGRVRGLVAH